MLAQVAVTWLSRGQQRWGQQAEDPRWASGHQRSEELCGAHTSALTAQDSGHVFAIIHGHRGKLLRGRWRSAASGACGPCPSRQPTRFCTTTVDSILPIRFQLKSLPQHPKLFCSETFLWNHRRQLSLNVARDQKRKSNNTSQCNL